MSFGLLTPKIYFDAIVDVKKGRYRLSFTNVHLKGNLDGTPYDFALEQTKLFNVHKKKQLRRREEFTERFHELADGLATVMKRAPSDDDW